MKLYVLLLIITFIGNTSFGQQPQVINLGLPGEFNSASDALIDSQGNHIVCSNEFSSPRARISFLNSNMAPMWTVEIDSTYGFGQIIELANGEYFAYFQDGNQSGAIYIKFDSSGIQWINRLDNEHGSIYSCVELSNGNIALNVTPASGDKGILVIDQAGSIVWGKSFDPLGSNAMIIDVINTNDDQIVVLSTISGSSIDPRISITKMDYTGNIVWDKSYEKPDFGEYPHAIIQTTTDDFYTVGSLDSLQLDPTANNDIITRKFDVDGNYLNGKVYVAEFTDRGNDLVELTNGDIAIVANTRPLMNCAGNVTFLRIKTDLDTVLTRSYGEPSGAGSFYYRINKKDDILYTAGYGSNWTFPGESQGHLLKTNSNFELPCLPHSRTYSLRAAIPFVSVNSNLILSNLTVGYSSEPYIPTTHLNFYDGCTGTPLSTPKIEIQALSISPNPASTVIQIELDGKAEEIEAINVYDLSGKKHISKLLPSTQSCILDVSKLTNGIYIVNVKTKNGIAQSKTVINH